MVKKIIEEDCMKLNYLTAWNKALNEKLVIAKTIK
jgi:hypothetical protein